MSRCKHHRGGQKTYTVHRRHSDGGERRVRIPHHFERTSDGSHVHRTSTMLGKGGFCRVFKCHPEDSEATYALKIQVNKDAQRGFERERDFMAQLNHPNIVEMYDTCHATKRWRGLLLEYCAMGDLWTYIKRGHRALKQSLARSVLDDLLSALSYLHARDILHRDIKPGNLLLTHDYTVKLCDFGLSSKLENGNLHATGRRGTANYMAPETIQLKIHGRPADMWGVGATLYVLIWGHTPFRGTKDESKSVIYRRVCHLDYHFPPGDHSNEREVRDVVTQLLQKAPQDRLTLDQVQQHAWLDADKERTRDFRVPRRRR